MTASEVASRENSMHAPHTQMMCSCAYQQKQPVAYSLTKSVHAYSSLSQTEREEERKKRKQE